MSLLPSIQNGTAHTVSRQAATIAGIGGYRLASKALGQLTRTRNVASQKRGILTIVEQGHEGWRLTYVVFFLNIG